MGSQLVPARPSALSPRRISRALATEARSVRDQTQLAALQVDAALALGGHIVDGVTDLYEHKRLKAADDPALDMLLGHVLVNTVTSLDRIQRRLFSGWDL